jgi:hypothetical protein
MKTISTPSLKEFGRLVAKVRKEARKAGLKKSDLKQAIAKARKEK